MKYAIKDLYPTPVYFGLVEDKDEIQKEFSDCIGEIDFKYSKSFGQTHHLSDPTFKEHLFEKYKIKKFVDELQKHLGTYMSHMGFQLSGFSFESSWISLYRKGDYAHVHHHGGVDISGAYYHKINKEDGDGQFFFTSPNLALDTSLMGKKFGGRIPVPPEEGALLLFPGWLPHGVETHQLDVERIVVSFNIHVQGQMMDEEMLSKLYK